MKFQTKALYLKNFLLIALALYLENYRPNMDILYYLEERDDKGELIKAGHYVLLRRATLMSQPENEKVYG